MEVIGHRVVLGECIKKIRTMNGLSQIKLAEKAHIAQSTLVYIENGLKSPNVDTVFRLCRSLSITMVELEMMVDAVFSEKHSNHIEDEQELSTPFL